MERAAGTERTDDPEVVVRRDDATATDPGRDTAPGKAANPTPSDADTDTTTAPDADTDTGPDADTDAPSRTEPDADATTNAKANTTSDADAVKDADAVTEVDGVTEADAVTDADAVAHADADAATTADDGTADAETADAVTEADAVTHADAVTEADAVTHADAVAPDPSPRVPGLADIPRPSRRVVATALTVLLLLSLLVGGDSWLRHRREQALQDVAAAYQRGDCAQVREAWRRAGQAPAIPGRRQAPGQEAERAVGDCRALQSADELAAAGDTERAFSAYLELRESPSRALAEDVVGDRLVSALDRGDVVPAPGLCRDLRGAVGDKILRKHDAVPPVLTGCGELLAASAEQEDRTAAFALVSAVRRDYPESGAAPGAATVEAELRLAVARRAPHTATTPFRVREAPAGDATVRFVNHSPWPVTLTLAGGKGGGHVVGLKACPSCGPYLKDISFRQCMAKGAGTSVTVPAGRYEMALQYAGDGPDPSHGFWDLRPGAYEECYFFTR